MPDPKADYPELPLDAGVDTYTAPEKVVAPKHLELEDAELSQPGALNTRRAYAQLSSTMRAGAVTGAVTKLRGLLTDGKAVLAAMDSSSVYSGAACVLDGAEWLLTDYAGQFPVTRAKTVFDQTQVKRMSLARAAGHYCLYAQTSESTVEAKHRFVICRESDDTIVRAGYFGITVSGVGGALCQPQLLAAADRFWLIWVDGTNLKWSVYDPAANQTDWSSPTTAFGNVHATQKNIDAFATPGGAVYVVYNHNAPRLAVAWFASASGALVLQVNQTAILAGVATDVLGVTATSTHCAIAYRNGANMDAQSLNASTLALLNSYSLETAIVGAPCEVCLLAYASTGTEYSYSPCTVAYTVQEDGGTSGLPANTRFWRLDLATVNRVQGQTAEGLHLTRKPVRARGSDFWGLCHTLIDGTGLTTEFLAVDYRWTRGSTPAQPRVGAGAGSAFVAQINPLGGVQPNKNERNLVSSIVQWDSAGDVFATPSYERITHPENLASFTTLASRVKLHTIDLRNHIAAQHFVLGEQLFVGGAYPRRWYRDVLREGFVDEPRGFQPIVPPMPGELASVAQSVGGSLTLLSTYRWVVTQEYVGSDGRRAQSAPSVPLTLALTGANNAVTLTFGAFSVEFSDPSLLRGVDTHFQWVVWRTTGSATEPIYYRAGSVAAGTATFLDQTSDSDIEVNEILYTSGGELENQAPPPSVAMFPWKDRLVCLHGETGELWPSKSWDASEVGGWNIALAVQTNVWRGLPKYAVPLDDKIVVFWEDAIGVVYGEPASDTGEGGTLLPPLLIKKRIGLRDVASVLETPDGYMFRARDGFYALGRDLSVTFVGRAAAGLTQQDGASIGECVGAQYVTDREEARFLFADRIVVCHVTRGEWWLHKIGDPTQVGHTVSLACGVVTDDDRATIGWVDGFTAADYGPAWREQSLAEDTGVDPETSRPDLRIRTAWLKLGGLFGQQRLERIWLIGLIQTGTALYIRFDLQNSVIETKAIGSGAVLMHEVHLSREDCHAVSLELRAKNSRLLGLRVGSLPQKGVYQRQMVRV